MAKVVNIRHKNPPEHVYIGRGSLFGNPFVIGVNGTREKVIELYKDYFYDRIVEDEVFKDAVLALHGFNLGCYCAPQACHGEVILSYLDTYYGVAA